MLIHGFGDHSGRYKSFVGRLGDLDLDFAMIDLRGHGMSGGERVYVENFGQYISDIKTFFDYLKQKHRIISDDFHLFGHSMGGAIASCFALEYPMHVKSLILSSPCFVPTTWIPLGKQIAEMAGAWQPHCVLKNPVKPFFLSHDPQEIKDYSNDPLIQRRIALGLLKEMIRGGRMALSRASEIRLPVYLFVAGKDRIVKKDAIKQFYRNLGAPVKEWREFGGYYHDLFRETDKERCFDALHGLLEKRVPEE